MKNGYFLIGEVSKITGISKDTLHFYSKTGLVVPDYIDPENQYRYYSRWNMWQLDIVATCRKLRVPLEKVKTLMSYHNNQKIVELLAEYQKEALRLSAYYQQVADDIDWYQEQNRAIAEWQASDKVEVRRKNLPRERVIIGRDGADGKGYHANLQAAVKEILQHTSSIQKKYGYLLDISGMKKGAFIKQREYLKLGQMESQLISQECIYELPEGEYAVCVLRVQNEKADFHPLLQWLDDHGEEADMVFAEELGLQLFDYIPDYYCEIKAHLKRA